MLSVFHVRESFDLQQICEQSLPHLSWNWVNHKEKLFIVSRTDDTETRKIFIFRALKKKKSSNRFLNNWFIIQTTLKPSSPEQFSPDNCNWERAWGYSRLKTTFSCGCLKPFASSIHCIIFISSCIYKINLNLTERSNFLMFHSNMTWKIQYSLNLFFCLLS